MIGDWTLKAIGRLEGIGCRVRQVLASLHCHILLLEWSWLVEAQQWREDLGTHHLHHCLNSHQLPVPKKDYMLTYSELYIMCKI